MAEDRYVWILSESVLAGGLKYSVSFFSFIFLLRI